jgi:hypothetical protein
MADLRKLADKWPSTLVARDKVGVFSGGLLHPRTMANHDSAGTGVKGRFRLGRKIAYPVPALLEWMESRLSCPERGES